MMSLILKNKIYHLIYFYVDEDATHSKFKAIPGLNVIVHKGAPDTLEDVKDMLLQFPKEECKAVVFDDLYNDLKKYMTTLFTVTSLHQNACFFCCGRPSLRMPPCVYCLKMQNVL